MELHQRVKALRRGLGLTQDEFGARLGASRSVINNLERGVCINANSILPLVKLIAWEFDVDEDLLLHGDAFGNGPIKGHKAGAPGQGHASQYLRRTYRTSAKGELDGCEAAFLSVYLNFDRAQRRTILKCLLECIKPLE